MASRSIPGAIIERFGTFTYTNKPATLWFGEAPLRDTAGNAVTLPLVEFYEEGGGRTPQTFEHQAFMCQTTYRFEVWANTLESCTDQVLGLLFDGDPLLSGSGFYSGGTLTFAASSYNFKAME